MKVIMRFLAVFVILITGSGIAIAADNVFGINIEQDALDVLTLAMQRFNANRYSADLDQVISVKAKIIVTDVIQAEDIQVPSVIFKTRIEIIKSGADMVRVNMINSFGNLQLIVEGPSSKLVLLDDGIYTNGKLAEMVPSDIMLPNDDGGLFTFINLLGGIPFGSLLGKSPVGAGTSNIGFVEKIEPSDIRAIIRYRGLDKTDAGMAYVVTIGSALYKQYIKIWVLQDSFELYQISIEDERGTEVFVVISELDTSPISSGSALSIDTSGLKEVSNQELIWRFMLRMFSAPAINSPVVADLSVSPDPVARTGEATVKADGFDLQDKEDRLICKIEYKKPGGSWTPLETEYAGLAPVGHWNAYFRPDAAADLGLYSFRVRFIDRSGNTSDWLESPNILNVTPEPPYVTGTVPRYGATGISVSTKISVTFNEPMDKNSVEKAFYMISRTGRKINGSFAWAENTLTFSPEAELQYNTPHLVRINGFARDAEGVSLDGNFDKRSSGVPYDDYIWEFTTAPATPMLTFVPAKQTVYKGDSFDVRIMAEYVTGMHKLSFKVAFNPAVFEIVTASNESFRSWRPNPKYNVDDGIWKEPVIDNSGGFAAFACDGTRDGGVSGTGYIANLTFKCISKGLSLLEFRSVSAFDVDGRKITLDLRSTKIEALEFHPRDTNHDGVVDINDFTAMTVQEDHAAPSLVQFKLDQNYPNPFNPETWIPYQLAQSAYITIKIYRATGEVVRTMNLGYKDSGAYKDKQKSAYWDGTDDNGQKVSSGVYFYTIQAGSFNATRKMLLSK